MLSNLSADYSYKVCGSVFFFLLKKTWKICAPSALVFHGNTYFPILFDYWLNSEIKVK